jgi:hypothetical protein
MCARCFADSRRRSCFHAHVCALLRRKRTASPSSLGGSLLPSVRRVVPCCSSRTASPRRFVGRLLHRNAKARNAYRLRFSYGIDGYRHCPLVRRASTCLSSRTASPGLRARRSTTQTHFKAQRAESGGVEPPTVILRPFSRRLPHQFGCSPSETRLD